ncbi:unnamed protein product, partial [marine sediment metagenome]
DENSTDFKKKLRFSSRERDTLLVAGESVIHGFFDDNTRNYDGDLAALVEKGKIRNPHTWISAPGEVTSLKRGKLGEKDVYVVRFRDEVGEELEARLVDPYLWGSYELVGFDESEENNGRRFIFRDLEKKLNYDLVLNKNGRIECPYIDEGGVEVLPNGDKIVEMIVSGAGITEDAGVSLFSRVYSRSNSNISAINLGYGPVAYNFQRLYFEFNTDMVPDAATIEEVSMDIFVDSTGISVDTCSIHQMSVNPSQLGYEAQNNHTIWEDAGDG